MDHYQTSNNLIEYSVGDGEDTIFGYSETDIIYLKNVAVKNSIVSGSDLKIEFDNGSITLEDVADTTVRLKLSDGTIENLEIPSEPYWSIEGTTAIYGTSGNNLVTVTGLKNGLSVKNGSINGISIKDNVVIVSSEIVGDGEVKITGNEYALEVTPTGLSMKNNILTASDKFTEDAINLNKAWESNATKVNAASVSHNLIITGNVSSNSIKAGKGDDTLNGGLGNDTLTGGKGKDVFVYEGGNDLITDYTADQDSIQINGTISETSYKGKDVIFNIGEGTLTVKNGKGKEISVTDTSGTQIYSKTFDLLYDDNFATDEFKIDDITEEKVDVTEIQTSKTETFAQDENILTFTEDK